jgi:hypothetical protein
MTTLTKDTPIEARRDAAQAMLDELLSQPQWEQWMRARRHLHSYSWTNQALIAYQAAVLGFAPTLVKAGWKWKRDGFHPAKGSRALYVWVFKSRRRKDRSWTCCGRRLIKDHTCPTCGRQDHYFQLGPVFDASQVVSFDTGQAPELPDPPLPINGNGINPVYVRRLVAWLKAEHQIEVVDEELPSSTGGYWSWRERKVALATHLSPNGALAVLIHETAHALGITAKGDAFDFGGVDVTYDVAEVLAECVAFCVTQTVGLDTSTQAVPYMAHWAHRGADVIHTYAKAIDTVAKTIEEALCPTTSTESTQASSSAEAP